MKYSRSVLGLAAGVMLALCGNAQAVTSISLIAVNPSVTEGEAASFELWMDFTGDPTLGGVFSIVYDNFTDGNQLSFVSYTPNLGNPELLPGVLGDPELTSAPYPDTNGLGGVTMAPAPTPTATGLSGISFGSFDGLEGPDLIGTLVFTANLAGGPYTLTAQDGEGFYSTTGPQQIPFFDNTGAQLSVGSSPVPLPASAWLMLSGLSCVAGLVKRNRRAA